MKPLGTTRLKVTNPKTGKKYLIEFDVVPDDLTPLLGARAAQQMGLITVHEDHFVPKRNHARISEALQQLTS